MPADDLLDKKDDMDRIWEEVLEEEEDKKE